MMGLDEFRAKEAEKNAALNAGTSARKANEGANTDRWGKTQELVKAESDYYAAPSGGKKKQEGGRAPQGKKETIEISHKFVEREERTHEGRGGSRGRGGERGARGGERGDRRGGAPRGAPRGAAPRGGDGFPRGGPRGGRGASAPINPNDTSAFPSLGSK